MGQIGNILSTKGPGNSRTFYLGIRLFEVHQNIPKFITLGRSLAYSRFFDKIRLEFYTKNDHTVLPRISVFLNFISSSKF